VRHMIHHQLRRIGCIEKATLTLTQRFIEVKNSLTALRRGLPAYGLQQFSHQCMAGAGLRTCSLLLSDPHPALSQGERENSVAAPGRTAYCSIGQLSGLTQFHARDRSKGATGAVFSA
jgi:hypothetical protein